MEEPERDGGEACEPAQMPDVGGERWVTPFLLFGGVGVLWVAWLLCGHWVAKTIVGWTGGDIATAGQFGDMFGSVNALFTALAFAAVTWSAFMQRREMALQRQEMTLQRKELRLQRDALEEQRQEMERQRAVFAQQTFESTFFQMLSQSRSLYDRIHPEKPGATAMAVIASVCTGRVLVAKGMEREQALKTVGDLYVGQVYAYNKRGLGPYFRVLYHLFKFIDEQHGLSLEQRRKYANLARAHLSGDDAFVLAVNGCSAPGLGFRPYIESFGLLKHIEYPLDTDHASLKQVLHTCYAPNAFLGADDPAWRAPVSKP